MGLDILYVMIARRPFFLKHGKETQTNNDEGRSCLTCRIEKTQSCK